MDGSFSSVLAAIKFDGNDQTQDNKRPARTNWMVLKKALRHFVNLKRLPV